VSRGRAAPPAAVENTATARDRTHAGAWKDCNPSICLRIRRELKLQWPLSKAVQEEPACARTAMSPHDSERTSLLHPRNNAAGRPDRPDRGLAGDKETGNLPHHTRTQHFRPQDRLLSEVEACSRSIAAESQLASFLSGILIGFCAFVFGIQVWSLFLFYNALHGFSLLFIILWLVFLIPTLIALGLAIRVVCSGRLSDGWIWFIMLVSWVLCLAVLLSFLVSNV
jgi:hypothetical protein